MSKKKIGLVLFGLVVLAAVGFKVFFTTTLIKYDNEIKSDLRGQMQKKGLEVLNALRDENYDIVIGFFSPETEKEKTKSALPSARAKMGSLISSAKFKPFHDHHVTGLKGTKRSRIVMSEDALSKRPDSYFVYHNANTDEVYVSLFTSEVSHTETLYTIIWGKYGSDWKIHYLDFGNLGWSGKRGPAWLEQVKSVRRSSGDIAAYLTIKAVSKLFRPSQVFEWNGLETKAKALYEEITKAIAPKFKAPIVMEEIESKPTIYGIDAMTVTESPGQVIPAIQYVSKYKNSQTDLVKKEANQMAPHIEKYFDGVKDLGENLLFAAYEEPPTDPKKQYQVYRTVVKIK